jgi:hypothetical protein
MALGFKIMPFPGRVFFKCADAHRKCERSWRISGRKCAVPDHYKVGNEPEGDDCRTSLSEEKSVYRRSDLNGGGAVPREAELSDIEYYPCHRASYVSVCESDHAELRDVSTIQIHILYDLIRPLPSMKKAKGLRFVSEPLFLFAA